MLAMARAQLLICCLWLVLGSKYVHMLPCKENASHNQKLDVDYREEGHNRQAKSKELSIKIKIYQPENERENPCSTNEENDCEQSGEKQHENQQNNKHDNKKENHQENKQENHQQNKQENQLENLQKNQNPGQTNGFQWIFNYISHWELPLPTYRESEVSSLRIEPGTETTQHSPESPPTSETLPPIYGGCVAFCP
ncbi:putative uncharacterized protein DDB_G0288537 [Drosophila montana]|uniref:putative uncharacterized protein DDB_G0288537 n=1 Tax=Drosophila montana TaxID=40370 RepID=UPI00313E67DE